jgi:hypothetical protein
MSTRSAATTPPSTTSIEDAMGDVLARADRGLRLLAAFHAVCRAGAGMAAAALLGSYLAGGDPAPIGVALAGLSLADLMCRVVTPRADGPDQTRCAGRSAAVRNLQPRSARQGCSSRQ